MCVDAYTYRYTGIFVYIEILISASSFDGYPSYTSSSLYPAMQTRLGTPPTEWRTDR